MDCGGPISDSLQHMWAKLCTPSCRRVPAILPRGRSFRRRKSVNLFARRSQVYLHCRFQSACPENRIKYEPDGNSKAKRARDLHVRKIGAAGDGMSATQERCPKCKWKLRLFKPIRGDAYYRCRNPKCDWIDPKSKITMVPIGDSYHWGKK